jgi:hypothetical protein
MTAPTTDLTVVRCPEISLVIFLFGRSQEFLDTVLRISADFECVDLSGFAKGEERSRFATDLLTDCHLAILCWDPGGSGCDDLAQMIVSHCKSMKMCASLALNLSDGPTQLPFVEADTVVHLASSDALNLVVDIASCLAKQGLIGIDAGDIREVIQHSGTATLLFANGVGIDRTQLVISELFDHWPHDLTSGGQEAGISLVVIAGVENGIRASEVKQIMKDVRQHVGQKVNIFYGVAADDRLGDSVRVSLLLKMST